MGVDVPISWRAIPVLLGVGMSLIACSLAVAKTEQYRLTYVTSVMLWSPLVDAVCMVLLCSGSVWCSNTIMSSGITFDSYHTSYDIGMMIVSGASALFCTLFGYVVASYDRIFTKTKLEILHIFISDSVTHNIESVRNTSTVMRLGLLKGVIHIIFGGILMGIGVFSSHILLVASLHIEGLVLRFNVGILIAAALISLIGSILSCWMLFRLLSFYPHKEVLRVVTTLILCATHIWTYFTILSATSFHESSSTPSPLAQRTIRLSTLRDSVLCAFLLFLWSMAYLYHVDMRNRHYTSDRVLRKTDDIMSMLQHDPRLASDPNILRYHHLRRKSTRRSACCGFVDISEVSHVPSILLSRSRSSTKVYVENIQQSAAEEELAMEFDGLAMMEQEV